MCANSALARRCCSDSQGTKHMGRSQRDCASQVAVCMGCAYGKEWPGARCGHPGSISAMVAYMTEFMISMAMAAYCLFYSTILGGWSAPWLHDHLEPC